MILPYSIAIYVNLKNKMSMLSFLSLVSKSLKRKQY